MDNDLNKIKELYNKIDENSEFEIMYGNYQYTNKIPIYKFINVLNYIKYLSRTEELQLKDITSLDINYNTFRISINDIDNINNVIATVSQKSNNDLLTFLITKYYGLKDFTFINKLKTQKNIIDCDEYDIRFRLSSEKLCSKKDLEKIDNLSSSESANVLLRYKNRISLIIFKDKHKGELKIELTIVNSSNKLFHL